MNETREIPEGQGAPNMHEDKGKPPLLTNAGNIGKKKDLLFGVISLLLKGEKTKGSL